VKFWHFHLAEKTLSGPDFEKNAAFPEIFSGSDAMAQSSFTFARLHSRGHQAGGAGKTSFIKTKKSYTYG